MKLYTFCLQQAFHSKLHQNNWKQLSDSMVNALSNPEKLKNLALKLGNAWLQCNQIPTPGLDEIPISRSEAYFVQDQMAEVIGDSVSGWKVGATSTKMRELDGHDDVIPGRIFESVTFLGAKQNLPISRFMDARAETEFAFRLLEDIPLRETHWNAQELKEKVVFHPAVELIGNRHQLPEGTKSQKSLMTIADNGGGIGFVFGEEIQEWQSVDFQHHLIDLRVDDQPSADNFLGEMRCIPIEALADLINHLGERGISLNAGNFISTGAATVPQPFSKGSKVSADFGVLGRIELQFS